MAPIEEIKTGLSVKEIASRGTAASITPSERLETMLDAHIRLNAGFMTPTLLRWPSFTNYFAGIKILVGKRYVNMGSFMGNHGHDVGTHELRRTGCKKATEPMST